MIVTLDTHPSFCPVPWQEMTIDPQGWIVPCCHSTDYKIIHISKVSDLNQVFESDKFQDIRKSFENQQLPPSCARCVEKNKKGIDTLRTHRLKNIESFNTEVTDLIRLEVDLSNLCNQQCVMCSSTYSTQWTVDDEILSEWGRNSLKYRSLEDIDLNKIIKIVNQLVELTVKGGEPTIDPRFEKLLEHVNPKTQIRVVTNLQNPRPKIFEIIKKLPNLKVVVSVDGTNELYNWIRGGDWDKTRSNLIELGKSRKNFPIQITMSLNYWSLPTLSTDLKNLQQLKNESGMSIAVTLRVVTFPQYTSAEAVSPAIVREQKKSALNYAKELKISGIHNLDNIRYNPKLVTQCIKWANEISKIRNNQKP